MALFLKKKLSLLQLNNLKNPFKSICNPIDITNTDYSTLCGIFHVKIVVGMIGFWYLFMELYSLSLTMFGIFAPDVFFGMPLTIDDSSLIECDYSQVYDWCYIYGHDFIGFSVKNVTSIVNSLINGIFYPYYSMEYIFFLITFNFIIILCFLIGTFCHMYSFLMPFFFIRVLYFSVYLMDWFFFIFGYSISFLYIEILEFVLNVKYFRTLIICFGFASFVIKAYVINVIWKYYKMLVIEKYRHKSNDEQQQDCVINNYNPKNNDPDKNSLPDYDTVMKDLPDYHTAINY